MSWLWETRRAVGHCPCSSNLLIYLKTVCHGPLGISFFFFFSFFFFTWKQETYFLQIMSSKPLFLPAFSSSLSLPAPAQKRDAALPRHVLCTALQRSPTTDLPLPLLRPCRVTLHCSHRPLYLPGPSYSIRIAAGMVRIFVAQGSLR